MDKFTKWGGRVLIVIGPLGVLTTILAHQDKLQGFFWWLIGVFVLATVLGFVGLLLDLKPWRWRVFRRPMPSYLDASGQSKCPQQETFGELASGWQEHARFGDAYYSRKRLDKFHEWPSIQELSCRLLGHSAWTNDTYNRLVSWLLTEHLAGNRSEMLAMPRKEVVRVLQEAVNKKQ